MRSFRNSWASCWLQPDTEYGQAIPAYPQPLSRPDTGPYCLHEEHLKAQSNAPGPLLGPTPKHGHREIPYPPAFPPVSRERGNVFLEDSSESSRIHSFARVRVPQGTKHICKGCWGGNGEGKQVTDWKRRARGGSGGRQQPLGRQARGKTDATTRLKNWGHQHWQMHLQGTGDTGP